MARPTAILLAALVAGAGLSPAATQAAPAYGLSRSVLLGPPDRWDYVVFDPHGGRVYAAHGDKVAVFDAASGDLIGQVEGVAGGTHGVGLSWATGQGFTDDGKNGLAVAFDPATLKVLRSFPAGQDADAVAVDPVSGKVFVVDGEPGQVSVIDPKSDAVTGVIGAGETLEYAAADGLGAVFFAGRQNSDLVKIDARSEQVTAHWPTPDCEKPHGLALDTAHHRAFMGCVNSLMMVVDTDSGKVVAELLIGRGNDAVAFDAKRGRVFAANGLDGTVSVYQQLAPDRYQALPMIATTVSARTLAVDSDTGRLFVLGADTDPPATPGGRPRPRPGTLRMMLFDPAP